jgi:hypothetical protein
MIAAATTPIERRREDDGTYSVVAKDGDNTVRLGEGLSEEDARQLERNVRLAYSYGRRDEARQRSAMLRGSQCGWSAAGAAAGSCSSCA